MFEVLLLHTATTNSNFKFQLYIIHSRITDNLIECFKAFIDYLLKIISLNFWWILKL